MTTGDIRLASSINWFYNQIPVDPVNQSPDLEAIDDQVGNVNDVLSYDLIATDPDAGDTLTISLVSGPSFCSLAGSGAALDCLPMAGDEGDYTIEVMVTDDGDPPLTDAESFQLTILPDGIVQFERCSAPFILIEDLIPVDNSLTVADNMIIEDLDVTVQIGHSFVGDLVVSVGLAGGASSTLINRAGVSNDGSCGGDNIDAVFNDEGTDGTADTTCLASDPSIVGSLVPSTPLSGFDGMNISGEWTLSIEDQAAGDTGFLGQWCVRALLSEVMETDADGDGVFDSVDNCTDILNADQRDTNGDGHGNVCDADYNNDCVVNFLDLGVYSQAFNSSVGDANYNADTDSNGDGSVNFLDLILLSNTFLQSPGPSATECVVN